jgi:hypothetical protein
MIMDRIFGTSGICLLPLDLSGPRLGQLVWFFSYARNGAGGLPTRLRYGNPEKGLEYISFRSMCLLLCV